MTALFLCAVNYSTQKKCTVYVYVWYIYISWLLWWKCAELIFHRCCRIFCLKELQGLQVSNADSARSLGKALCSTFHFNFAVSFWTQRTKIVVLCVKALLETRIKCSNLTKGATNLHRTQENGSWSGSAGWLGPAEASNTFSRRVTTSASREEWGTKGTFLLSFSEFTKLKKTTINSFWNWTGALRETSVSDFISSSCRETKELRPAAEGPGGPREPAKQRFLQRNLSLTSSRFRASEL